MYKVNNKKLDGFSMCSKHGKCYSAVVIVINVAIAAANSRSTVDTYTQLKTKQKRLLKEKYCSTLAKSFLQANAYFETFS